MSSLQLFVRFKYLSSCWVALSKEKSLENGRATLECSIWHCNCKLSHLPQNRHFQVWVAPHACCLLFSSPMFSIQQRDRALILACNSICGCRNTLPCSPNKRGKPDTIAQTAGGHGEQTNWWGWLGLVGWGWLVVGG